MRKFQPVTPYDIYWTIPAFNIAFICMGKFIRIQRVRYYIGHFIGMFFDWSDHLLLGKCLELISISQENQSEMQ